MQIVVYTKAHCPNCVTAKRLLDDRGIRYMEWDVQEAPKALERLLAEFPQARQMPQIFINNQRVGGLAGLQAALKQVGL
jgi:glutaredoxin 3